MTVKFGSRILAGAFLVLIASATEGRAQQIVNLVPAPGPNVDHQFRPSTPILVSGGTNPASPWVTIVPSWTGQPAGRDLKGNGDFTTHFPFSPPGSSTVMAPAADGEYTIVVRAWKGDGTVADTKTITIRVISD